MWTALGSYAIRVQILTAAPSSPLYGLPTRPARGAMGHIGLQAGHQRAKLGRSGPSGAEQAKPSHANPIASHAILQ